MRRDERMARLCAERAARVLQDGEVIDLGRGKKVPYLDTPHTPHGWDAGVVFEESTGTLLCGDLFTQLGNGPALTTAMSWGPRSSPKTCSVIPRSIPEWERQSARSQKCRREHSR